MVLLKPDCDGNKNLFSSNDNGGDYGDGDDSDNGSDYGDGDDGDNGDVDDGDNGGDYGDGDDHEPLSVESLCVNCKENGITRILFMRIPFYQQVILLSFHCDRCGYSNNELQSGEPVQEHGVEIVLNVSDRTDLNRQVVISQYAEIEIPELELVIPAKSQPGEITTVEGILCRVRMGLEQDQEQRREIDMNMANKINDFLKRIEALIELRSSFTVKIRDASGNSFIQNPVPLQVDRKCIMTRYQRTMDEKKIVGLISDDCMEENIAPKWRTYDDIKSEVLKFPTECTNCNAPTETRMKLTDIPYFESVIIMCTTCDVCGHKTNEVKSGCAVKDKGCKLILRIEEKVDLDRDVLKSDTCYLAVPELELEVGPNTISGKFTTVEGLLLDIRKQLKEQESFIIGDSRDIDDKSNMANFLTKFDSILTLEKRVHLILDDPAGNSYIQSLNALLDDRLGKEFYERSFEQNEELGLNDMKTENYGQMEIISEEKNI
ncbi:unnamed protein product [Dracunculus medinensis]|uniref:Zinc finger protein ZPR1 n=1 Tax=Dracunculus medinensis TaxID=318479 RepID=A0A0N4UPH7_DRAME|nr:unnamed protein product [Dracunculus medinensis]